MYKLPPSPEKSHPSFQATPSKNRDPVNPAPLLFENLVGGSTLPPPRGDAHYEKDVES